MATRPTRTTSGPGEGRSASRSSHAPPPWPGAKRSISTALRTTATGRGPRALRASRSTAREMATAPAAARAARRSAGAISAAAEEVVQVPDDDGVAQAGQAAQQVELDAVGVDHVGPDFFDQPAEPARSATRPRRRPAPGAAGTTLPVPARRPGRCRPAPRPPPGGAVPSWRPPTNRRHRSTARPRRRRDGPGPTAPRYAARRSGRGGRARRRPPCPPD